MQRDSGYRDFGYLVKPAAQIVAAYQADAHSIAAGDHTRSAIRQCLGELGYPVDDPVLADLLTAMAHIASTLLDDLSADSEVDPRAALIAILRTFVAATPARESAVPVIVADYTQTRIGWRVVVSTTTANDTIVRGGECSGPPQAYQKAQVLVDQIKALLPQSSVRVQHQVNGQEAGFRRWADAYGWV